MAKDPTKRSDLRSVKTPLHRNAAWNGGRGAKAEAARVRKCAEASRQAAVDRTIETLSMDIWAEILPKTSQGRKVLDKLSS